MVNAPLLREPYADTAEPVSIIMEFLLKSA